MSKLQEPIDPYSLIVIRREGKCALAVTKDKSGKYVAFQILRAVRDWKLMHLNSGKPLEIGMIITSASHKPIELINDRRNGYWDVRYADEQIELTEDEIEELKAAANAVEVEKEIVTRHGDPSKSRINMRFHQGRARLRPSI